MTRHDEMVMAELRALREKVERLEGLLELVLARIPEPGDLVSTEEARTIYGLSRSTLYRIASFGALTKVKRPGRRGTWWRREEIEAYLGGVEATTERRGRRSPRRT